MRKFSDIKGEEALDVLADILVPVTTIANDEEVRNGLETNIAQSVSVALKKHKAEVMQILAAIDGTTVEELDIDLMTLPTAVIEFLEEPAIQSLFM